MRILVRRYCYHSLKAICFLALLCLLSPTLAIADGEEKKPCLTSMKVEGTPAFENFVMQIEDAFVSQTGYGPRAYYEQFTFQAAYSDFLKSDMDVRTYARNLARPFS